MPGKESQKDYYSLLGVSPQARPEVIRAAFLAMMNIYHPDHNHGDDKVAKQLNEANAVLSDQIRRAKYDREREGKMKGETIGPYKVLEPIASGGFGTTYKGKHQLTGGIVCIKKCSEISSEYNDILLEEAEAMWDLRHFAIPAVRDVVRLPDNSLSLVTSFIPGLTLEKVVEKFGKLDPEAVVWIAERVLNALKYIHFHGVVHGDIKPQNIIVQPDSHMAVLVDFGLSAIKPTSKSDAKGYTQYFAPPEQIGGKPIIPESDLYSMGVTMIYALAGGRLDNVAGLRVPSSVPDGLCDFIKRLIVRDATQRPSWSKDTRDTDLGDELKELRLKIFGRKQSGMKSLRGA